MYLDREIQVGDVALLNTNENLALGIVKNKDIGNGYFDVLTIDLYMDDDRLCTNWESYTYDRRGLLGGQENNPSNRRHMVAILCNIDLHEFNVVNDLLPNAITFGLTDLDNNKEIYSFNLEEKQWYTYPLSVIQECKEYIAAKVRESARTFKLCRMLNGRKIKHRTVMDNQSHRGRPSGTVGFGTTTIPSPPMPEPTDHWEVNVNDLADITTSPVERVSNTSPVQARYMTEPLRRNRIITRDMSSN